MKTQVRMATLDDLPEISQLIAGSARGLGSGDYSEAEIEAALQSARLCYGRPNRL